MDSSAQNQRLKMFQNKYTDLYARPLTSFSIVGIECLFFILLFEVGLFIGITILL
jgi:hypothetical protein